MSQMYSHVDIAHASTLVLKPIKSKYAVVEKILLDKIFSNQVPKINMTKIRRPMYLDKHDSMHTTNCIVCDKECMLVIEMPVCTDCRMMCQ